MNTVSCESSTRRLAALLGCLAIAACGAESPSEPDPLPLDGTLEVRVATTGDDPSQFYTLVIDGQNYPVDIDETLSFPDMAPGGHDLELKGQDYNCRVVGTSTATAIVTAGSTASVAFDVECAPKSIVFISGIRGTYDLFLKGVTSTETLLVEDLPASKEDEVAISPDGLLLAFASDVGGDFDIYVRDQFGTLTNLTKNPGAAEGMPSWSPDGAYIVYRSYVGGNEDIWVMDADGSNQTPLIATPARERLPQWSPDGSTIAFVSNDDGAEDIWLYDLATQTYTKLTASTADDEWPSWSPDGLSLAFASWRDGNSEIYVMNADGTGQTNVSKTPGSNEWLPAWSPDGRYFTFNTDRAGNLDIYWMRRDGTAVTPFFASDTHEFFAVWHPTPWGE